VKTGTAVDQLARDHGMVSSSGVFNCVAQSANFSANISSANYISQNGIEREVKTSSGITDALRSVKMKSAEANDKGITVGGSVSDQRFVAGAWFPTDGVKHVFVLKLLGEVQGKQILAPVTVKTKQECPTCGTLNKHTSRFCRECGTGLSIV
jgi:ribosomal protein S27AE